MWAYAFLYCSRQMRHFDVAFVPIDRGCTDKLQSTIMGFGPIQVHGCRQVQDYCELTLDQKIWS